MMHPMAALEQEEAHPYLAYPREHQPWRHHMHMVNDSVLWMQNLWVEQCVGT
jgi:hypothetical protein